MTQSTIQDNDVGGDLAGRDIHKHYHVARQPTAMAKLVQQYLAETSADRTLSDWIEKLDHYLSNRTNPDIRGLEDKLKASGRDYLLASALLQKQNAYKAIMKQQGSKSAQTIYAYLMAEIVVNFEQSVLPKIQAGESADKVDSAMLERVINPALNMLEDNPLMLDKRDIQGLVYFLAGSCYVRWDALC